MFLWFDIFTFLCVNFVIFLSVLTCVPTCSLNVLNMFFIPSSCVMFYSLFMLFCTVFNVVFVFNVVHVVFCFFIIFILWFFLFVIIYFIYYAFEHIFNEEDYLKFSENSSFVIFSTIEQE